MVLIAVVSDTICPWCYVGKRRLEKALQQVGEARVVWRPFELNPGTPRSGLDRAEYLNNKYGRVQVLQMEQHLTEAAAAEGIQFRFDRATRIPNTFDSHRLIWLAGHLFRLSFHGAARLYPIAVNT